MEMVQYWKTKNSIQAKVTKNKEGALIMYLEGEKYPFPGFPRGYLLYGKLSKLKHEIKNQIFNDSWAKLEKGMPEEDVAKEIKSVLSNIFILAEETKYDMVPVERMVLPVRELYRAWTKIATSQDSLKVRDIVTFIFQEDDSYRFRFQWMVPYFTRLFHTPVENLDYAFSQLEHGEVIGDMKERVRLWRRIFMALMKDKSVRKQFEALWKEINWKKVKLSKKDKFHFRGKYFKVDYELFEY